MLRTSKKIDLSPRLKFGVNRKPLRNRMLKYGAILSLCITAGLTTNAIRLVLKTSAAVPAAPQVLGATDTRTVPEQSEQPAIKFIEYKIQKGDTLFNVSQKFNITWTTLATLNNLSSPYTLTPGKTLKIPR